MKRCNELWPSGPPPLKALDIKEHPTRKHGKNINEAVGWRSDGVTQSQCEALLAELRVNQKSGQGPQTLKEMRTHNQEKRAAEAAAKEAAQNKNRTLAGFWEAEYWPRAALTLAPISLESQRTLMRLWLAPVADKPLSEITSADLEKLVARPMAEAGLSPGRIRHALTVVSVVWEMAPGMV